MIRILSLVLTILFLTGMIVILTGYSANPKYEGSIKFKVLYSYQLVWQELVNIQKSTQTKRDVKSVEVLEQYGKLIAWKENLKNGGYRIYRMNERIENRKLTLELTDSSYGLKGKWTFDLVPSGSETEVNISEESTLDNTYIRGYRSLIGRDYELLVWQKYIRVGLVQALLTTP